MSIIVCYTQTNDSHEERRDEYYEELLSVIVEIPERDMKIVIGDLNAKVGRNNQGMDNVMGVEGLGKVANEIEEYFISFCPANNLVIGILETIRDEEQTVNEEWCDLKII
ncbi:craniofacial development protein 2-like [Palaemon carinicauda]|uniref:craniofacial development protein 2-like n=1 Tax=Palaemon carinicauda TaxID=392227 RepID=UPI0035B593EF